MTVFNVACHGPRVTAPKLWCVLLLVALCATLLGCGASERNGPKPAGRPQTLETLLNSLPADMRDNLCHNELRRARTNEWLEKNIVGRSLAHECTVRHTSVTKFGDGRVWIRFWLEEQEIDLLGEHLLLSIGPGCYSPGNVLFDGGGGGLAEVIQHALVFQGHTFNPSNALIETSDARLAESLADLRGKRVKLLGTVLEFKFYPVDFSGAKGGLLVRLGDATLNGHATVASLPLAEKPENPWDLVYEPVPSGKEPEQLLAAAKLLGKSDDANAPQWSTEIDYAEPDSVEGKWQGRWRSSDAAEWKTSTEPVMIVERPDRLFIRFTDAGGTSLVVARKVRDKEYAGRYVFQPTPAFVGLFAARVVSNDRIDGAWLNDDGSVARWDFRREARPPAPDTGIKLQDFLESLPPEQ